MIYLKHSQYGVIAVSRMPRKHVEEYTQITKEEYEQYLEEQLSEQETEENN